jgi:adhesin/invasin
MDADGTSTTLVTVRVLDAQGVPVGASAGVVTLASTLGTTLSTVTDHADGTYTATLTAGTVAGPAIITGALAGTPIANADTVLLRPVASPITTTITADSASIVADGKSATIVTVRVLDVNGVPVGRSAGVVTLATTRGILSAIVDHQDGTYTATLRADTTPPDDGEFSAALVIVPIDTAVVTGTLNGVGIADSARVEFRPDPEFQFTGTARNRIPVEMLDTRDAETRKQRLIATHRQPWTSNPSISWRRTFPIMRERPAKRTSSRVSVGSIRLNTVAAACETSTFIRVNERASLNVE